jgi:hypothetical protein
MRAKRIGEPLRFGRRERSSEHGGQSFPQLRCPEIVKMLVDGRRG